MVRNSIHEHSELVKIIGVLLLVVGGTGAIMYTIANPATASMQVHDVTVPDASIESADVREVTFYFESAKASWANTPEPVTEVQFRYYVEGPDGEMHQTGNFTCEEDTDKGWDPCPIRTPSTNDTVSLHPVEETSFYLIERGPWNKEAFQSDPGEEVSHTIDVKIEVEALWDGGSITESATDTTTITVTNPNDPGDQNETEDPNGTEDASLTIEFGEGLVSFSEE